jgi:hypothetical protein
MTMLPTAVARNLVVCEDIVRHADNPQKVDLLRVVSNFHVVEWSGDSFYFPELCVYAALSEARGLATLSIHCVQHPEGGLVFSTPEHPVEFSNDPLQVIGIPFRIRHCVFPALGMYSFQLWYNVAMLDERYINIR